eukprot:2597376-Amphidinium_carterae.1
MPDSLQKFIFRLRVRGLAYLASQVFPLAATCDQRSVRLLLSNGVTGSYDRLCSAADLSMDDPANAGANSSSPASPLTENNPVGTHKKVAAAKTCCSLPSDV